MSRDERLRQLRVGTWYTICCDRDLGQIEDEADIEWLRDWIRREEPTDYPKLRLFATYDEAFEALRYMPAPSQGATPR